MKKLCKSLITNITKIPISQTTPAH